MLLAFLQQYGFTAAMYACRHLDSIYIDELLKVGAEFDLQNFKGETAFILAKANQNHEALESALRMNGTELNRDLQENKSHF
jgi:ankyrin repeat protein